MMKWVLIGIGALVVFQYLNSRNVAAGGKGILAGGSTQPSGVNGIIGSLTSLTNSIGKIIGSGGGSGTSVKDPDALISPNW